ncbi:MAG TPA: hypothetical protein VNQ90_15505 [Chthoniobacteraceae bacterium]|nr:hypothetical protein [Chthoniobacteraceae bacterium]
MNLSVPYRYLKALACLCRKDKCRPALSGILIEIAEPNVFLVATDGMRLGVISMPIGSVALKLNKKDERRTFIVPLSVVDRLHQLDGYSPIAMIVIKKMDVSISIGDRSGDDGCASFGKLIDGGFPYWRQVFAPFEVEPLGSAIVDPILVRGFGKVGTILKIGEQARGMIFSKLKRHEHWEHTDTNQGQTPVVIRFTHEPNFVGLLMPMKSEGMNVGAIAALPYWVKSGQADRATEGYTERWGDRDWIVPPGARILHLKRQEWIPAGGIGELSGRGILYRIPADVESEVTK